MASVMPEVSDIVAYENGELSAERSAVMMQKMINGGMVWRMQGAYGRAAMAAIKAGECMLGVEEGIDYWKNPVPARSQIKKGTPGSREYVVQQRGEEWAKMLEAVE
jgi:hypothetical protein